MSVYTDDQTNTLFDAIQDYAPQCPTLDEQLARESDERDWRRADLQYQTRVEAGVVLTQAEREDWHAVVAALTAAWAADVEAR